MLPNKDLLIELGTEELPPKTLADLGTALAEGFAAQCRQHHLSFQGVQSYAAPRHLAIWVMGLEGQQPPQTIERRGPALSQAFDAAGQPTRAALGFAESCGVEVSELGRVETAKGAWLYYRASLPGQLTEQLIPTLLEQTLAQLPIKRSMRWGTHSCHFLRPVHWLVCLWGDEVLPIRCFDHTAACYSYGHRVHHPEEIPIPSPATYADTLRRQGLVEVNFAARQERILQAIRKLEAEHGFTVVCPDDLLAEVCGLVEWPVVLLAHFEPAFLRIPEEVLITSMQVHQRCFAIRDRHNKLLPQFVLVSNLESREPEQVIAGNERVMHARLSDAKFYFEQDQKQDLHTWLEQLKAVTFQTGLGSLYDKSKRLETAIRSLAPYLGLNPDLAKAGLLAKVDLMSLMVGEFPELQGIMGGHYAQLTGKPLEINQAIAEHYYPRFAKDQLPSTPLGQLLAVVDRLDTLVGLFGIGKEPTGEKDPFALRRQALACMRILRHTDWPIGLSNLLQAIFTAYGPNLPTQRLNDIVSFCFSRLKYDYEGQVSSRLFAAVLAVQNDQVADFDQRIQALETFLNLPEADILIQSQKRVSNLLSQSSVQAEVDPARFNTPAEQALYQAWQVQIRKQGQLLAKQDYVTALTELAGLAAPLERFFSEVFVLDKDPSIQANRLALLAEVKRLFYAIADFSLL